MKLADVLEFITDIIKVVIVEAIIVEWVVEYVFVIQHLFKRQFPIFVIISLI